MQTIETIARIVGPIYLIVGIGLLLNAGTYRQVVEEYLERPALCYMGGLMALIFGLLILVFHDDWSTPLSVVVGILGWLATLKGAVLIIHPKSILQLSSAMMGSTAKARMVGVGSLIFGGYLELAAYGLI